MPIIPVTREGETGRIEARVGKKLVRPASQSTSWSTVVCTCQPSHSGGYRQEDCGLRQVLGKNTRCYLKNH
jgi:hypothetical protein